VFLLVTQFGWLQTGFADEVVVDIAETRQASPTVENNGNAEVDANNNAKPTEVVPAPDKTESKEVPIYSTSQLVTHPQAQSVELDEPVINTEPTFQGNVIAPVVDAIPDTQVDSSASQPVQPDAADSPVVKPLLILDTEVFPSTTTRLSWAPNQSFEGISMPTPVLIVNGASPGPVLCLTAALHGDELNGIEIVRRVLYNLKHKKLSGTVIGVPIVNLQGFRRSSRYLTDRRDLNRYFPGNPDGSSASRIAYSFFHEVIKHCSVLVDLHTGSMLRDNLPQVRADMTNPRVAELAQGFGSTVVLHNSGASGALRRAATQAGIPAVTLEAGESMRLQEDAVEHGVKGIRTLMHNMRMIKNISLWGDPASVYYRSGWVRVNDGGILFREVELGDKVDKGDLLGRVTDPITNIKTDIYSPHNGKVLGMAVNQVVLPGFAAFHIGIQEPQELVSKSGKKIKSVHKHNSSEALDRAGTAAIAKEQGEPSDPSSKSVEAAVEPVVASSPKDALSPKAAHSTAVSKVESESASSAIANSVDEQPADEKIEEDNMDDEDIDAETISSEQPEVDEFD
jgi:predicted deacylase